MKVLAFSDVHGNVPALRALLEGGAVGQCDASVFCGDVMGYFAAAEEAIGLLKGIPGLVAVKGNHDAYYLDAAGDVEARERLSERFGCSYRVGLSDFAACYLRELPECRQFTLGGRSFYVCHGSPEDPLDGRVYPDTEIREASLYSGYDVVFCGHTHYRMERMVSGCLVVNPGSLGQPRDGGGFSYCVYETDTGEVRHFNVNPRPSTVEELLGREPDEGVSSYLRGCLPWSGKC